MYCYRVETKDSVYKLKATGYYAKKVSHSISYGGEQIYGLYFFKSLESANRFKDDKIIVRFKKELIKDFELKEDLEFGQKGESFYVNDATQEKKFILPADIEMHDKKEKRWKNILNNR